MRSRGTGSSCSSRESFKGFVVKQNSQKDHMGFAKAIKHEPSSSEFIGNQDCEDFMKAEHTRV
jgi:hypothetical protein